MGGEGRGGEGRGGEGRGGEGRGAEGRGGEGRGGEGRGGEGRGDHWIHVTLVEVGKDHSAFGKIVASERDRLADLVRQSDGG